MKNLNLLRTQLLLFIILLFFNSTRVAAQRIYADNQTNGASGILCLNCNVVNAANAADGNPQTFSVINVTVGIAAQTRQDLIFTGTKPTAGKKATLKLGSGNDLLSLQALGAIFIQAYNGSTAIGSPVAANSLLTVLSNNNQFEVSLTPAQNYDRVRITLNGGLIGALNSLYVYEAYFNGNGPVPCNIAIDELHGISAGLLNLGASVGGVVNARNAIDGNINTASTLNAGVGLVGAFAQQAVIFNNASASGDSVRLTLSVPQALLDAGVLSNISVSTYNGNTSNNDTQFFNSAILNLRLLDLTGGQRKVTLTFAPPQIFDRVQLTLGGGIASVLSTLNLFEAERVLPSPVVKINNVVTNTAQVCTGSAVTLTATAAANTTFNWYTQATGGVPVATGATFTTPALTATTTYYAEAVRAGCTDASQRTAVKINVNQLPSSPVITNNNLTVCLGQTTSFTAQSVNGVTINWYSAATGGTSLATGNTFTTPALSATTSYYAEAVAGGTCISTARTMVTANITTPPDAPVLTAPNVSICDGNVAVLSVNNPLPGVTYNWYGTATGGAALATGSSFTTPVLHTDANYYAEAANAGGCISATRTHAVVTVIPPPANPTLGVNNTAITLGQTATITVTNAQAGVTYNFYTSPAAVTPIATGTSYTTPPLFTTATYYAGAVNGTGCMSAARIAITLNVNTDGSVPACAFASQQTVNVNGLCIGCGVINAAAAADADSTTASSVTVLAGLAGGYTEQYLQFQQAGFAGDTVKLVLRNPAGLLDASVTGQIEVALYNGITQVARYTLSNSLLQLRLLGGGNNRYAVYIPATAAYDRVSVRLNSGVASLLTTLQVYYASQQYPKPVFSPASPEICKGSQAVLNITAPLNGTFNWYTSPTGGTPVATGTSFTTPVLNANTVYYVEYSRGTCTGTIRYPIQVLVDDTPAAPVIATQNVTVNSGQPATLNASSSNNATIQWFADATGTTALFTGNTFITPPLTQTTTYYAGSISGSCISVTRTPVTVTVQQVIIPDITVTPAIQMINPGQTATFTASSTLPGAVFNWFTTATGGTSIYTGATFTTPPEFANTTFYAEASIPSTGAVSARASGTVVLNTGGNSTPPDVTVTPPNRTVNSGETTMFTASSTTPGATFKWYTTPTGGTPIFSGATFTTPPVTANTVYYVEAIDPATGLVSLARATGTVTLNMSGNSTPPDVTVTPPNRTVNSGETTTFTVSSTTPGATFKWYTTPTGGTPVFSGATFTTPPVTANTVYYVEATDPATGLVSLARATGTVTLNTGGNSTPPDVTVTPPTRTVNSGETAMFTASSTTPGATFNWYTTPTGGTPIFSGPTFTTPPVTANTVYYVEAVDPATGLVSLARATGTVTLGSGGGGTATPPDVTVTPPTRTVNSGETAMFTASSTTPGATFNWYTTPTGGTPIFSGPIFTTPPVTANTVYYVEATDPATGLVSLARATGTVTLGSGGGGTATPPDITVTPPKRTVISGETTTFTASSTTPGATFKWYTTPTGGTPIFSGATFTTPPVNANTIYYVEAVDPATGLISPTRATGTVTLGLGGGGNSTPPDVTVTPPTRTVNSGETTTFTASSTTPGATFKWYTTPTGGTPIFSGATFTTPPVTANTVYYVEAVDPVTGKASTTRAIATVILGAQNPVFIPNAFSPNGDGNNDVFYIYGTSIKNLTFWVYDQWGGMLYRSTSQAQGWDGTYKGKSQPVGVYVYYMEGMMNDGQKITKKGTINLLR